MTTIDQMWTRLAQHQPFADERGYGKEWRTMCEERLPEAADEAADEVEAVSYAAWAAARAAAWAAEEDAENVQNWAELAIEYINKAEGNS